MIALTYGMITNIDDRIGMVMDALRASGADRNTVVVFTSDHGDLMGDHGIVLKGPLHYQSLVRVPLIWREPGRAPAAVRDDLVSSIDLPARDPHPRRHRTAQRQSGPCAGSPSGTPLDRSRRRADRGEPATRLSRASTSP
jgi:hypothetical protein